MKYSSRALRALLAACAVLFLSIGTRQGFGLFMQPAMSVMSRQQFSLAVATQYLVWGVVVAASGMLSQRMGVRRILIVGSCSYALGLFGSSFATGFLSFWIFAGVFIGIGLGAASFGILDGVVARSAPPGRRGFAMGIYGASAALGQMSMLVFTHTSIDQFGWHEALRWHALAVAPIAVAAMLIPTEFEAPPAQPTGGSSSISAAISQPFFWTVGIALAFAGLQTMATMTHLPAYAHDRGWSDAVAARALLALSITPFIGSLICGWLCDRIPPLVVLSGIYLARSALAFTLAWADLGPNEFVGFCAMLGLVWMAHLPTTSTAIAARFGTVQVAAVFSIAFLLHQTGGFTGTWAAAAVRDATGSYTSLWLVCGALCACGSLLAFFGYQLSGQPLARPQGHSHGG
jgi:MFS family permease